MKNLNSQWMMTGVSTGLLIVAYGALIFFGMQVFAARTMFVDAKNNEALAQTEVLYGESVRMLLRETTSERAVLAEYVSVDAADIVEIVRAIGEDASVSVNVDTATPVLANIGGYNRAPVVDMIVSAEGSFGGVFQFVELLEVAPMPLLITGVTFETQDEDRVEWRAQVRLKAYTEEVDNN